MPYLVTRRARPHVPPVYTTASPAPSTTAQNRDEAQEMLAPMKTVPSSAGMRGSGEPQLPLAYATTSMLRSRAKQVDALGHEIDEKFSAFVPVPALGSERHSTPSLSNASPPAPIETQNDTHAQ